MSLDVRLLDGSSDQAAKVNGEGELNVVVHPHPPRDEAITARPFRQRLVNSSASSDMAVDGSSTAVDFYVEPSEDFDAYIAVLNFQVGDAGGLRLDHFGGLGAALTNGIQIFYQTLDSGSIDIHEGIKTNLEFIRTGYDTFPIGDTTNAFRAETQGGGAEDSYLPIMDLSKIFKLQYGIRLRKATNDRVVVRVRDNLTGLTTFDCIATGLQF